MPKPESMEVFKRRIRIVNEEFDMEGAYKAAKAFADKKGYDFVESDHVNKPDKYGRKYEFKSLIIKDLDPFARYIITVELLFFNINQLKNGFYKGDCVGDIKSQLVLDYKNKYGGSKLMVFFFKLYFRLFKDNYIKRQSS